MDLLRVLRFPPTSLKHAGMWDWRNLNFPPKYVWMCVYVVPCSGLVLTEDGWMDICILSCYVFVYEGIINAGTGLCRLRNIITVLLSMAQT